MFINDKIKILLISDCKFILNNFRKLQKLEEKNWSETEIEYLKNIDDLFRYHFKQYENYILFWHFDTDNNEDLKYELKTFLDDFNYLNLKIVILRNKTEFKEGCELLKLKIDAYCSSMSNEYILFDIKETLIKNRIWIYPELMNYLINGISIENNKNSNLLEKLTPQEKNIAQFVSQGLQNSDIASTLNLKVSTIKKHISSIFKKLNIKDRLSLALLIK